MNGMDSMKTPVLMYILGDARMKILFYSNTNETAHLIKSPIHPILFRITR